MLKKAIMIGACMLSMNAFAANDLGTSNENHPLTLVNTTKHDSTMKINGWFICSSAFGDWGITHPDGKPNVIPYETIKAACSGHAHDCTAQVFMSSDCSGDVVAIATYDIDKGVLGFPKPAIDDYVVSVGDGFHITMSGGN